MPGVVIELTLNQQASSKVKLLWDYRSWPELLLVGVYDQKIASSIWSLGQPFTSLEGVGTASQFHDKLAAEYSRVDSGNMLSGMKLMSSSLDVTLQPTDTHLSPGWLSIRDRLHKSLVYNGRIISEVLV